VVVEIVPRKRLFEKREKKEKEKKIYQSMP